MDAIMNRHDQVCWSHEWGMVMRHMQDIYILTPQCQRNYDIISPEAVVFGLVLPNERL